MFIKKITIKNLGGIRDLEYTPEKKIATLCQRNGVGKTSFLEAVRFLLTGNNGRDLFRNGTEGGFIEAVFNNGDVILRGLDKNAKNYVKINGKNSTIGNMNEFVKNLYHCNTDEISVTSSADIFANMGADKFNQFVMMHLPDKLTRDKLISFAKGSSQKAIEEIEKNTPDTEFGTALINKMYTVFYEKRKAANSEVNKYTSIVQESKPPVPVMELGEIEEKQKKVLLEIGQYTEKKNSINLYERILNQKKTAEQKKADLKARIKKFDGMTEPTQEIKDRIIADEKAVRSEIESNQTTISVLKNNIDFFEKSLKRLDKKGCPLSDKLQCTVDKTPLQKEMKDQIVKNKRQLNDLSSKEPDLIKRLNTVLKNKETYEKAVLLWERKKMLEKELKEIAPVDLPERPAAFDQKAYDQLLESNKMLQAEKQKVIKYEEYKHNKKHLNDATEEYTLYSELTAMFSTKGMISVNIVQYYLGIFEKICNNAFSSIGKNVKIKFVQNKGLHIYVKFSEQKSYTPYHVLSSGEKTLVSFVLLDMCNQLTGFDMLLIDNLDNLDRENIKVVIDLLKTDYVNKYSHIFISSVDHDEIVESFSELDTDSIF